MLIPGISSSHLSSPATNPSGVALPRNGGFQQIAQALQSGNLSSATQIFTALTQNAASSSAIQNAQVTQDLNALGTALQSGNLSAARQAYSSFKQDLRNANPATGMHHHHHHGRERIPQASSPGSDFGANVPTSVFSANGSNIGGNATSPGGSLLPFGLAA